jgi:hypothetical protein
LKLYIKRKSTIETKKFRQCCRYEMISFGFGSGSGSKTRPSRKKLQKIGNDQITGLQQDF